MNYTERQDNIIENTRQAIRCYKQLLHETKDKEKIKSITQRIDSLNKTFEELKQNRS